MVGGLKVEVEMDAKVAVEGDVSVGVGGGSPRSMSTRQETMTGSKRSRDKSADPLRTKVFSDAPSISTPPPSSSGTCKSRGHGSAAVILSRSSPALWRLERLTGSTRNGMDALRGKSGDERASEKCVNGLVREYDIDG